MDLLTIARRKQLANEKTVEKWCDDLIAQIAGKQGVVRFSQARETNQTRGIADRLYSPWSCDVWFEVKSEKPDAQLSREQSVFLRARLEAGVLASCGRLDELRRTLDALREELFRDAPAGHALAVCAEIVQDWEGRGFRGEKKPRRSPKETRP